MKSIAKRALSAAVLLLLASCLAQGATDQPGKIYIHIFTWPASGNLELPAVKGQITSAYLLADKTAKVEVRQTPASLSLTLPEKSPDEIASVVCLDLK